MEFICYFITEIWDFEYCCSLVDVLAQCYLGLYFAIVSASVLLLESLKGVW